MYCLLHRGINIGRLQPSLEIERKACTEGREVCKGGKKTLVTVVVVSRRKRDLAVRYASITVGDRALHADRELRRSINRMEAPVVAIYT